MRHSRYALLAAIAMIAIASGCNNATSPQQPLNPGSLTADIQENNGAFISSGAVVDSNSSSYYLVTATQDHGALANEIHLTIPKNITLPGTVRAVDGADVLYYEINNGPNGTNYEANASQGTCSITVTQISPTFEGTFSATTICTGVVDNVRTLTKGAFNVSY